jgi:hypothetical protein
MEKEEYQSKKDRIIDNLRFLLLASLLNFVVLALSFIFDFIWWRLVSVLFSLLIVLCIFMNNSCLKSLKNNN